MLCIFVYTASELKIGIHIFWKSIWQCTTKIITNASNGFGKTVPFVTI